LIKLPSKQPIRGKSINGFLPNTLERAPAMMENVIRGT